MGKGLGYNRLTVPGRAELMNLPVVLQIGGKNIEDYVKEATINGVAVSGDKSAEELLLQKLLESGVNIKTINGNSILGEGNMSIGGTTSSLASLGFAEFSAETDYSVGTYVAYDGALYKCISAHTAGAWNANHFTLTDLKTAVQEIVIGMENTFEETIEENFLRKGTYDASTAVGLAVDAS